MKINTRALLILGITVLVLILALNVIAQMFIISSSEQIEQQQSDANVRLVLEQIRYDADQLGDKARDWAVWDDTYQYMTNQNREYYDAVIVQETTYEGLQINGLLLYDISGNPVASQGYDPVKKIRVSIAEDTIASLSKNLNLLSGSRGGKKRAGIVRLPDGLFLVGMHTILPTSGSGPGHGTLVMFRSLDDIRIASISNRLHLPVIIYDLNDPDIRNDPVVSRLSGAGAPSIQYQVRNAGVLAGYTLVNDINSQPVMLLEVGTPRTVSQQASALVSSLIIVFLMIGILYIVVTLLLLDYYIISPLSTLDTTMKEVGKNRVGAKELLPVSGDDEIASLKQTLNLMLQELQEKETARFEAERRANLYLDVYLDMLTYEILNVTASLKTSADLVAGSEGKDNEAHARRITEVLSRNLSVIRNIETISRIYKNPPMLEPLLLADVLRNEIKHYPDEKIRWDDDCSMMVLADGMLGTVLHNIFATSIRSGKAGIEIRVSARDNNDGTAEVSVIDTGRGIPDGMKARLFDRLIKDPEEWGRYGLELHIVKLVIEAYGGRVWADDRVPGHPEKGAVIRFTLKKA